MNLILSTQTELIKTKRSASFWLSVIAAAFIPSIFFLAYAIKPDGAIKHLMASPWNIHFSQGWQALCAFLFPMYIILICSLIPQIEYKNNTWKQVYASPQPLANIFFSKFLAIHLMILFFYVLFNLFMILSAVTVNIINSKFPFLDHSIDWQGLGRLCLKTYVSILGISAIQYWLSYRVKNFIVPVGIGLALLIGAVIAFNFGWEHIYKIPFAHPTLTLRSMMTPGRPLLENHELNAIGYCIFFLTLGYIDLKYRKEKG